MCIRDRYGHSIAGPTFTDLVKRHGYLGPLSELLVPAWRGTPEAAQLLGPVGGEVGGYPNLFPTTWITTNLQVSLRVPRSPGETEIWWYTFVPEEMDDETRAVIVFMANHVFGPGGLAEQEDGENWTQSTAQTHGVASRRIPQVLKMNLGRGEFGRDEAGFSYYKGHVTEHAQLWTYKAWADWMSGADWESLRRSTEPPDLL